MSYKARQIRENIINDPGYWVEEINGQLYDAIIRFMEEHKMNRSELAKHLNISKGRVSQLLNDGEINFSLEKFISLSLKIDRIPIIRLEKKPIDPETVDYSRWAMYLTNDNLTLPQENNDQAAWKTFPIRPLQEISFNKSPICESKVIPPHSVQKLILSHS